MDLRPLQAKSPPPHQPASTPPSYGSSTTRQRSLKAPLTILVADSGAKVAIPSTLAAAHADSASRSAAAQWTHAVAREINVDADSLILLDARTGKVVTTPPTAFGEDSPRQSLTLVAFDRRLLEPEHTSLSILEGVGPGETWMQPPVSMNVLVPLVIPSNAPMNVVLDSCFSTFKSNVEYARAVIDSSNRNLQTMERLFEEQKIQAQALRTALLSLQTHVKPICDAFDIFMAHSQKEIAKHAALIQNFPSDLQALHRIPMHNKITKSTETKFLSDYVPEGKLLAWVDKCRAVHDEFVKKNVALSETFKNLRNGTDAEASHALDVDFESLASHIATAKSHLDSISQPHQLLTRDFARVQSVLQDILARSTTNAADNRLQNESFIQTLTALENLQEIHTHEYIPAIAHQASQIQTIAGAIETSKMHSTSALRSRLRAVSHLQSVISQAASPSLTFQTQALAQLNVAFEHLLHVHRMPTAWGAVIVEIVRRREFWRVVFERGEVFADAVAKFIDSEKRRRQSFDTEIGRYLPRDGKDGKPVVWGLDVGVPRLEVKVVGGRGGPNDEFLPEIEKKDIYEFEQLISQIRTAMIDVDPMASAVRSANQTIASSPTSSIASPSNSISKLQATITKMLPQVDSLVPEFEKYVLKSGVCGDRFLKLEEEILRLKAEAGTHKSVSNSVTSKNASTTATAIGSPSVRRILASKSMGNFDATNTRVQETLKSYENRIRELEDLLQTSYYDSRLAKSTSVNGTSSDPTVQILQTENNTLKTRLAFLESQFTTTSDDLLAKETKLKELRGLFESDRKRIAEQDKEINELRSLVNEKDREGRMVVSEVERCAGFIREVSELVDECAEAFKVGGQETLDPMPLERHPPEQPSSADSNEGNMSTLRAVKIRSSTSSKYQSPTSPSTGLMALVNATQSFGTSNSPNTIRTASGFVNPMQHATPFTLLSNLRSDEQKIRKKLRELQDDIRCQTLELVGLQNDLANLGPRTESPHDGNTENGSEAVLQDGSVLEVGVFGSPSRSGMSDPSAPEISRNRFFEELQSSKREIKRLNDVIEELNNAFMAVKAEASGFLVKAEAERHELLEKDKKVTELNETIAKLMMEKSDATELYDEMVMKVERLKTVLSTVQAEKDTVESQLGEAMKNYDRLERAWSSRMQESTYNFEGEIRTLKAEISESKTFHSEKIRLLEAANGELRSKIVDLLESARKMEESLQNLKFDLITRTTEVGQKSIEIGRLEQLCGKFRVSVGRQKGHILRLKEKNKDWSIVCKMAVESLAARLDSLQKVGETLARFDEMFHGQYTPVDENSAAEFGFKNILQVSHVDVQSFKSAANDMSSRNPNSDENECGSENSELGSLSEDMRDLYHEIITAVDSVDVCSWAESVVQATNAWTEFLAQQRMKLSVSERGKIAFSSFREGDLALFLPTRHPKAWAAFNVNAPHYFLSTTSALESFPVQIKKRDWILGHISKIEHRKAVNAEGESGRGEGNPFGLVAGTSFHWCDVTPLQEPSQPQANASR